ncbi:MAG: xylulokinase [Clostridiales bacterium]|nr:xylulokinase [Clostridiales bacterium]
MKYVIGIDLGTSGVKTLLVGHDGHIVSSAQAGYTPDFYSGGRVEQKPEVWWENTLKALKELTDKNPEAKGNITATAVSGQMHSSVFLDGSNEVIRPAILWNDTRTTAQTKEIVEMAGGVKELLDMTCNSALEGFTLPKILWLKENEPENYAKVNKVIMPKDYINFMLSGNIKTDVSDAAGTLLFDVKNTRWSTELCKKTDLSPEILPEVIPSTGLVGEVKPELCKELGLEPGCKVISGGADNSCAAIGNGVVKEGQGVISIGTSGTVIGYVGEINSEVTGGVHLFNYSAPNSRYAMGCMLCAGEALNWTKRTFFENLSFDDLNVLAEAAPAGSGGLFFLPYLFGERSPHNDPDAKGAFIGIFGGCEKGNIIRSVMEGVGYAVKDMYEEVIKFTSLDEIFITGGGAKSKLWGQICSDILNKPLKVLNISEGPSYGAALIALVGSGAAADFEGANGGKVKVVREINPSENTEAYKKFYPVFRRLYKTNKENFKLIKEALN